MPASQPLPLKDIHIPATVGWWPPAIGWWLLGATSIALLVLLVWLIRRIRRKTAVKAAKKLLKALKNDTSYDNFEKLTQISSLMRRAAISYYPNYEIASLSGQSWLEFLDRSVKGKPFTTGIGQILKDAHFQQEPPQVLNIAELCQLCETWLNALQTKAPSSNRKK